jgi:hypothetical protein
MEGRIRIAHERLRARGRACTRTSRARNVMDNAHLSTQCFFAAPKLACMAPSRKQESQRLASASNTEWNGELGWVHSRQRERGRP